MDCHCPFCKHPEGFPRAALLNTVGDFDGQTSLRPPPGPGDGRSSPLWPHHVEAEMVLVQVILSDIYKVTFHYSEVRSNLKSGLPCSTDIEETRKWG